MKIYKPFIYLTELDSVISGKSKKGVLKMTREEIAKQDLKAYPDLGRSIKVQKLFFDLGTYSEGKILTAKEAKSFSGPDAETEYQVETSFTDPSIKVVFLCDGEIIAHKVDYQNKNEVDELSAVEGEDEYLVPAGTHFQVTYCCNEDDIKEMG